MSHIIFFLSIITICFLLINDKIGSMMYSIISVKCSECMSLNAIINEMLIHLLP